MDNIEGFGYKRKRENEAVARERFVESRKGRKWGVFEASHVAIMVKNLPAKQEAQVRSLDQEAPL